MRSCRDADGPIVLAAGGTGGHLFPAEALAASLLARGRRVVLVTDARGRAFGDRVPGVAVHRIAAGRLGGGLAAVARGAAETAFGTVQAFRILCALRPAAVIGFGGYPSVPTMLAAGRLALPSAIHEQNAVLGRANRMFAGRVERIAVAFPAVVGLSADRVVTTGNPVRGAILALAGSPYAPPEPDGPIRILVLGGSQGARVFSEVVPAAVASLTQGLRQRLCVAQQARPEDIDRAREAYRLAGVAAEVSAFFDDVPSRLASVHLVIARAGASTTAELAVAGRPAILVPYPYAADDHQAANARAFEAAGAAWVMPQAAFTPDRLSAQLAAIAADPGALAERAGAAARLARPDAAERLADLVLDLAHAASRRRAA